MTQHTPIEFAARWYTEHEAEALLRVAPNELDRDESRYAYYQAISDRKFREWFAEQLRLAMAKGIQFGQSGHPDIARYDGATMRYETT